MKIKVLEAFGEPISYGGQEAFVMNVLPYFDSKDMEVDLLSPYYCDNKSIVSKLRARGGNVFTLGCRFTPGGIRHGAERPISEFLRNHRYDVIHIHSGSNSMLAMYARLAHRSGIPKIIVHSHCTGKHGWKHFVSKALTSYSLRRYPQEYCACSRDAGEWRFPADICRKSLIVINDGINTDRFVFDVETRNKARVSLGLGDDTVLIGNVGRLTYQKNQAFLIEVLAMIVERTDYRHDYRLILVGDGEDREMLETMVKESDLEGRVFFTGAVDDVVPYLQAMDVAAMPSRYEGLSIAVIEAQAAGLEIVASDTIPEAAALTNSVEFLPLSSNARWAEALTREHRRHPEHAREVDACGYSTESTARVIRELYTGKRY